MSIFLLNHRLTLRQLNSVRLGNFKEIGYRKIGFRVGLSMLFGNGMTIGLQLLMVPILLITWGGSVYGEWVIIFTLPSYIALMDLGIISAANNRMDALCAQGRFMAANRTYISSIVVLVLLSVIVLIVAIGCWIFFNETIVGMFETLSSDSILIIYFLMIMDSLLTIFFNYHAALYRTINQFHLTVNWQSFGRVMPMLAVCLAASLGGGILIVTQVIIAVRFIFVFALAADLLKRIFWFQKPWMRITRVEVTQLIKSSLGFIALPVSNMLVLHVSTILVALVTSPAGVAAFSTIRTFTRLIPQLVGIIGRALWSEISKSSSNNKNANLPSMYKWISLITVLLTFCIVVCYQFLGPSFYQWWTRSELPFDNVLFLTMIAHAASIALYTSLEVFILARNKAGMYSLFFLASSIGQLVFGWIFIKDFGVVALPAFGFIGATIIAAYVFRESSREFNRGLDRA